MSRIVCRGGVWNSTRCCVLVSVDVAELSDSRYLFNNNNNSIFVLAVYGITHVPGIKYFKINTL